MEDISKMSSKELEQLLKKKQKQEREEQKRKRKEYEAERNVIVAKMIGEAKDLQGVMIKAKKLFLESLEVFKMKAVEYADIRKNSKGGFSLRSTDGTQRVVYSRNTKFEYDERAGQAEVLIKEFLSDKVKKRDKESYELIVGLMSKNKQGDYSPALIAKLLKHENTFDDERWEKAIQLFKESYREVDVSYSVEFYEKDKTGKDKHISLTFASL